MLFAQSQIAIVALISFFTSCVVAAPLTFVLGASEKACYYVFNDKPRSNIGYYFAVQGGGAFDVDYTVKSPDGRIIVKEEKQMQGDYIFNGDLTGEYEFCFSNEFSTFAEKIIDFEIKFENSKFKAQLPDAPTDNSALNNMQDSVDRIEAKINQFANSLQYYKTRNNRNQSTVKSTESRIFYFSFLDVFIMVGMAVFQVFVVKFFFQGSRKQLV